MPSVDEIRGEFGGFLLTFIGDKRNQCLFNNQKALREREEPGWKDTVNKLMEDDKDKAMAFADALNRKCSQTLKIVYALDEFIWEGPVGRSNSIQTVQLIETF